MRVYSLNQEVSDSLLLPPRMQLSLDHFTPLPGNEFDLINNKLSLPLKFRLVILWNFDRM